jgi:cytochrome c biogenesis protein CcmG/thiol:disulfide interchange protein DsbE
VGTNDFAGKPTILNVWATWCVGCRQEHGFLMELSESGTIPVYGLNWRDDQAEAQRFLQQLGDPYVDSAYDGDGRVGIDWGVYGAPETFLIGADGTVLYKHLGPLNWALWQEFFVPHLATAGPGQ